MPVTAALEQEEDEIDHGAAEVAQDATEQDAEGEGAPGCMSGRKKQGFCIGGDVPLNYVRNREKGRGVWENGS